MPSNRIIYLNWITEVGQAPTETDCHSEDIREEVRSALELLNEEERELIVRFYFMGESYVQISEKSGRTAYKLAGIHKRAVKKLRSALAGFVRERFQIDSEAARDCPLCQSPDLEAIDNIIRDRDRTTTWKPVIRKIKKEFGITINSPQLLIGHEKYHTVALPYFTAIKR